MEWWRWIERRLDVLFRKNDVEDELDEELRFHIEMETRQYRATGYSPEEARRNAMLAFGGMERFKEEVRDVRGARVLDDAVQDLKLALRGIPRRPAYFLAVVLTLGIGIGGNVAMFSVVDASVFASLPYQDVDRLVVGRSTRNNGVRLGPMVAALDYVDYRDQTGTFEELGAIAPFPRRTTLFVAGEAERVEVVQVSANFFRALGVSPVLGRDFAADEALPGAGPVAVLSTGFFESRFGSDPAVLGRVLSLGGELRTVVGVMPPEARFYVDADVWIPMTLGEGMAQGRSAHNWLLVGRLSPGKTLPAAQTEVDALSSRLADAYPDTNAGKGLLLTPVKSTLLESYRDTLLLLSGAVVLLLLVACANVAGLLLARTNARKGEIAVRAVMGASKARLVRQFLTENLVLATAAGAVGVVLAAGFQRALAAFVSMDRLGAISPGMSLRTLGVAGALSLATLILFGILPSLRAAGEDPAADIRGSGRGLEDWRSTRLRSGLVVAQVALTAILLCGAGLLGRTLSALGEVPLGFDGDRLLTAQIELPENYAPGERIAFFEDLRDRARAIPGVLGVGLSSQLPVRSPGNNWVVGTPENLELGVQTQYAHQRTVQPGFFELMGTPLLRGRDLEPADAGTSAVVISESLAEYVFGGEDPLGQPLARQAEGEPPVYEVVGVVGDAVLDRPSWGTSPAVYYPFHARPPLRMEIALRYEGEVAGPLAGLRSVVSSLDPSVPVDRPENMETILDRSQREQRALAVLVAGFGGVALLLAVVGLYGVLAYRVSRRIREIGIRMALGATAGSITGNVVGMGFQLVALGLAVGLPLAFLAGRWLESFLFGVTPADPLTLVSVAVVLGGVGAVACFLPALRATRVNPVEAFRAE